VTDVKLRRLIRLRQRNCVVLDTADCISF